MSLRVIPADLSQSAHAQALVDLLDAYARDPMGGGEPLSADTRARLPAALNGRPGAHVLIAYRDDVPVGLLNAFEGFSTFACQPILNIHDLAVLAEHRGHGVSRALMQAAEVLAREIGACKLTLEVLSGNTIAQAAYARFGFAQYTLDPAQGTAQFWQKLLPAG
ncbi:GNAT family N-acetyltransferase [Verticiella alkaliphila]|uniref:GNAT family N-acetyltransferase n=1 Tax=Verticiella alkaliphila TaxID=2779529 RepID=UPI003530325C